MIIQLLLWLFVFMNIVIAVTFILYDGLYRTSFYELYCYYKHNEMRILQYSAFVYTFFMLLLFNKDYILGNI